MCFISVPRTQTVVYVSLLLLLFSPCAVGDRNDDLQCIKTFFKDVLHREVESVKNGVYENEIVNGCLITEYYVNGECNVWVSGQLHAIIHYWQEGLECPSSNVTQSVSQKTAFELWSQASQCWPGTFLQGQLC